jgi:hypothetical protein
MVWRIVVGSNVLDVPAHAVSQEWGDLLLERGPLAVAIGDNCPSCYTQILKRGQLRCVALLPLNDLIIGASEGRHLHQRQHDYEADGAFQPI